MIMHTFYVVVTCLHGAREIRRLRFFIGFKNLNEEAFVVVNFGGSRLAQARCNALAPVGC